MTTFGNMRVVGVKQLKARLSEYLREVRRGETFLVTDRDEVIAELRPSRAGPKPVHDEFELALEALAETGQVTTARQPKAGWTWRPAGAGLPPALAEELMEDLRADRSGEPG